MVNMPLYRSEQRLFSLINLLLLFVFTACNPLAPSSKVDEQFSNEAGTQEQLSSINYSSTNFSFSKNFPISSLAPTLVGGPAQSFSVTPPLPTGLNLDSTTGVISGTPTTIIAASNYEITATAGTISVSTTISIAIVSTNSTLSTVAVSSNSVTANGSSFITVTVTLLDVNSNPIQGNNVSVSSSRGATDTIVALSATTNFSGEATFRVLSTTAGNSTLTAEDDTESLALAQTQNISFTAGAAAQVFFSTEPLSTGIAGVNLTTQPRVEILDGLGNLVTSSSNSVTLTLYSNATCTTAVTTTPNGGSSTSGTLSVNAVSGVADFSNLKINKAASALYFKASSGALTTDCSSVMNISPAVFSLSESTLGVSATTVNAGSSLGITLTAQDTFGNANPTGITSVSFSSTSNGGTGTFSGTTNSGNGVYTANFSGVLAGTVTLGGLINTQSISDTQNTTVNPGTIASLGFSTQPSTSGNADLDLAIQPVVVAKDAQGNIIVGDNSTAITLSAHSNSTCTAATASSLSAAVNPVTVRSGVATFANVKLHKTNVKRILATDGTISVCSGSDIIIAAGAMASLAFTNQPSATGDTDSPLASQIVITAYDTNSNVITSDFTSMVTLSAHSDSTCSTASVASSIIADSNPTLLSAGVATFSGVSVKKISVVRIKATSGSTSVCSNAMAISAGSITTLAFTTQPSTTGNTDSSLSTQPVVKAYDANSNIVTNNSTSNITLVAHSNSSCTAAVASGIRATSNPQTLSSGVATFAGAQLLKTNVKRILATDGTSTICSSSDITISAGAIVSIAFTTQPSTSANADTAFSTQPVITSYDANSNIVTNNSAATITLSAHSDSTCTASVASGITATANPATLSSGVATFAGVQLLKTNVKRILATDGTRSICSNADMTISAGAIASLAFLTQPSTTGNADSTLATQPVVAAYDANSNIVLNNSTSSITLEAHSNSSCTAAIGSGISATGNPVTLSAGVATFSGIKVLKTNAKRILATNGFQTICSSTDITISAGALASLSFTTQPSASGSLGVTLSTQPVVTGYDANSNIVSNDSSTGITLSGHTDSTCSTGAVASGVSATTNPLTFSSGVATFSSVTIQNITVVRLKALNGSISACSSAFSISAGVLASLSFSTQPSSGGNADSALSTQPVVRGLDLGGNTVTSDSSSTVTLTAHSDASCATAAISSGIVATTNPVTMSSGVANFAAVNVRKITATRIKATSGSFSVCSNAIAISAGALSTTLSSLASSPLTIAADGSTTSSFAATILDQYSNPISGQSVTLTSSRGATDTIATSPATTNSSGVATLTVKSSTVGSATLTLTAGSFSKTRSVRYLSYTPIFDFQARAAKDGTAAGDTSVTTWWKNLYLISTTQDFQLFNFPNPNTGWAGNGGSTLATDPYRLTFASGSSQYLEATTDLNSANDVVFETWVRPSSSTTKGSLILSNGNSSNKGFVLQQSSTEAGKVEFKLGTPNTYSDEVLADSPVGYWKLNDMGSTAYDLKNSSANGTISGAGASASSSSSAWNDGAKAMTFDGSDDYITFGDLDIIEPGTSDFTVEFWVKTTDTSGYLVAKSLCASSNGRWGIDFGINTASSLSIFIQGVSTSIVKVAGAINNGAWRHVVILVDRDGLASAYVDGVSSGFSGSVATVAATNLSTTSELILGNYNSTSGAPLGGVICGGIAAGLLQLNGSMHDFAIYRTLLSPTRIAAHYAAGTRPVCRSTSTLTDNSWTHLAGLFNSTSGAFKLFLNGTEECSVTLPSPTSLYAGSSTTLKAAPSPFWSGDISEIRAANTTVTNSQNINNYNATATNYPTFTPTSISGLTLWYSADDVSTLYKTSDCTTTPVAAAGDAVACWKNKASASNNATQTTPANMPVYVASSINSKPGIRFGTGAVRSQLTTTGNVSIYNRSVFIISKWQGAYIGSYAPWMVHTASPYYMIYAPAGNIFNYYYSSTAYPTTVTASGNQMIGFTTTNSNVSIRVNGNIVKTNNITMATINSPIQLGSWAANGLNGDILEVLVYDSTLSETNIKRVEAYLNAKYNLY